MLHTASYAHCNPYFTHGARSDGAPADKPGALASSSSSSVHTLGAPLVVAAIEQPQQLCHFRIHVALARSLTISGHRTCVRGRLPKQHVRGRTALLFQGRGLVLRLRSRRAIPAPAGSGGCGRRSQPRQVGSAFSLCAAAICCSSSRQPCVRAFVAGGLVGLLHHLKMCTAGSQHLLCKAGLAPSFPGMHVPALQLLL